MQYRIQYVGGVMSAKKIFRCIHIFFGPLVSICILCSIVYFTVYCKVVFYYISVCFLGRSTGILPCTYTDKKEIKIFLIHKEIQNGELAKLYMTNGLLIYGEMIAHFLIH
jgi:hypothetical protein